MHNEIKRKCIVRNTFDIKGFEHKKLLDIQSSNFHQSFLIFHL